MPDRAVIFDWAELLADYVMTSPVVCFLAAEPDGTIDACNSAMADTLKVPEQQLRGLPIWHFLTELDTAILRERIAAGEAVSNGGMALTFVSPECGNFSLECAVCIRDGGFAVIGCDGRSDERALQQEMRGFSQELLTFAQEHASQNQELREAKQTLENTLHDLNTFYWHLRKVREVLPICMKCGKVESQEARWEELAAFMVQHFPFLSHGYCPDCVPDSWTAEAGTGPSD